MTWSDIDDDEIEFQGPVRMIPMDFVYIGLGWASRLTEATLEMVDDLQHVVGGHINHLRDRDDFAERAALEIESLTNPEGDA